MIPSSRIIPACGALRIISLAVVSLALSPAAMTQAVQAQSPAQTKAKKTFNQPGLSSRAVRLEATIKKQANARNDRRSIDALRREGLSQIGRNNPRGALAPLGSAVTASPGNAELWYQYSRASILTALRFSNLRWRLLNEASAAAFISYQRARTPADEARALTMLGNAYAHRRSWRQALNSYKASIAINDNPSTRKLYETFRKKYGFRVLKYTVESDSLRPRVCFQFSEALAHGKIDFAPYVAISGNTNGAIVKDGRQLCVEGLKHGVRYSFVLRQGLPSAVDEKLLKSADYEIFVRDRSPQVRFTGKNYVLPRVGQEGIPVVSTNTKQVSIDILRVGDRSLLPTVRSDDFLAQIGTYRARELLQNKGVKVWSGKLDVKPELNKDVTTAFPALQALKKLEPGVYAMLAVAGDKSIAKRIKNNDDYLNSIATQWFVVSDLGLTAFTGKNGVHVFVRSLASAKPLAGKQVRLVARNNDVLATLTTDASGHAKFAPGLARGSGGLSPGLIVATDKSGDYNFLDLVQTPFDLSDRGVKGRPAAQPLDAYVYAERGVYRSGETVNLTALLRNAAGQIVPNMPLTFVVKRPDGVEYKRVQIRDQGLGGRALPLALLSSAPTGTWRAQIYADPKSPAIGETTFLVEDYVPERLDVSIKPQEATLRAGTPSRVNLVARFLYGAPGAGLSVNGELSIRAVAGGKVPGHPGFVAGLQDQEFETIKEDIKGNITTDNKGLAVIPITAPQADTTRPVEARIVLRAAEPGGRAVERVTTLPVRAANNFIAVKPTSGKLREGSTATFDVIALSPDGKRINAPKLRWTLFKVSHNYQWYNSDGRWKFERIKSSQKLIEGEITADQAAMGKVSMPVRWGAHRLEVTVADKSLTPVSVTFNVGWSGDVSANTPDLLDVTLNKKNYTLGEAMSVRVASRFAGKATIIIAGDKVHESFLVDVKKGDNDIGLPVKAEWGASAYAIAIAHRPLDQQSKRRPGRALGLAWFSVDADKRKLNVSIETPARTQPRRTLSVPVRIGGLKPGEEAYVTVAAVDVGILNLTGYKSPKPSPYFFGQRKLGIEIRDLYGLLIDGMQGTRGAIRSGGDGGGPGLEGNRPTQEPMARYSGIVKVGPDGVAKVTFELPAFNGTARIMAVAWSKSATGSAEKNLIIRDPVVVQATLPRFLNYGDRSRFHIQIDNVDGAPGKYVVELDVNGPVTIAANALRHEFTLAAKARTAFTVPVSAAGVGTATIAMRLTGPNLDAPQSFVLRIAPGTSELYRRVVRTIAPGQAITISNDLLADFLPGTGTVSVAASPLAGVDVPALLQALDRYPYGCSEQLVSRAMPLLYVNQLASAKNLALGDDGKKRIQKAIDRVLARQDTNGRFGLWSAGSGQDLWLDAFITDFLTRAREKDFKVPRRAFEQALDWLRNQVANTTTISSTNSSDIAYAVYVLARNGRPVMGDLRYLVETKLNDFASPLARAQLGAALALLGDRGRATKAFNSASQRLTQVTRSKYSRSDFGSVLRDSAGFLALAAEANAGSRIVNQVALKLEEERGASVHTSTQENAWMVLAAASMASRAKDMALQVDGATRKGSYYRNWRGLQLDGKPVKIGNAGQAPARVVVTTSGFPAVKEPPVVNGFNVERSFYTMKGKPVDLNTIKQNSRLVVVLKVTELEARYGRLLLVDHLPAGLEIDNPRLVDSGSISGLPWLKSPVTPLHTQYRDDRFVAAYNRSGSKKATFYAAYIARAVTPGRYVLPPATIEDMYRPDRYGRTGHGSLVVTAASAVQ